MGKNVQFVNNSKKVKLLLEEALVAGLHEAGGELVTKTVQNMKQHSDTGQTRNAWQYVVDEGELKAIIGNPLENAIWTEFGTGEYSITGKGRKTPWYVPVDGYKESKAPTYNGKVVIVYGKNGQKFYKTNGKAPQRPFLKAYNTLKNKIPVMIEKKLKEMMK